MEYHGQHHELDFPAVLRMYLQRWTTPFGTLTRRADWLESWLESTEMD
jgi:hypothetical protein